MGPKPSGNARVTKRGHRKFPNPGIIRCFENNGRKNLRYCSGTLQLEVGRNIPFLHILSKRRKPSYDVSKLGQDFPYIMLGIITAIYVFVRVNFQKGAISKFFCKIWKEYCLFFPHVSSGRREFLFGQHRRFLTANFRNFYQIFQNFHRSRDARICSVVVLSSTRL